MPTVVTCGSHARAARGMPTEQHASITQRQAETDVEECKDVFTEVGKL